MNLLRTICCFFFLFLMGQEILAQSKQALFKGYGKSVTDQSEYYPTDSGFMVIRHYILGCKNFATDTVFHKYMRPKPIVYVDAVVVPTKQPKLLSVHGSVSYDFYYRSRLDTPFVQQDLQQHTERIWLDILVKEKYPFRIGFTARESNSPFFKDLINANLNFDRSGYTRIRKEELLSRITKMHLQNPNLNLVDSALKQQQARYASLSNWLNQAEILQRIVEEREKSSWGKIHELQIQNANAVNLDKPSFPSSVPNRSMSKNSLDSIRLPQKKKFALPAAIARAGETKFRMPLPESIQDTLSIVKLDSLSRKVPDSSIRQKELAYAQSIREKKEELTKLEKSIAALKHSSDSIKNVVNRDEAGMKKAVYKARNTRELEKIQKAAGILDSNKSKLQEILADVKSFSVGRSVVDYTELTVQNVMLSGINIEYNPSYYAAVAGGTVDYGFRDIFGRKNKQPGQYLLLGRFGWGIKDRTSLILTVFDGRKNNYSGLFVSDSLRPASQLFGYSIETIIKKNEDNFFSAEIAKSTKNQGTIQGLSSNKGDNLFKFNDNTNTGFNLKAQTKLALTNTRLSGFYRKTGEAFQSFSLFTYNTNQQAWQLKADQPILKGQVNLTASLRQNDFTNPFTDKTFKTNTVFKSFQVSVRRPLWPVINAGYFPGTQLYIVDKLTIRENAYYILNGSVLYAYELANLTMNSGFIYNRYFNKATDSGFVLYKGVNYILSQSTQIKNLQLEGSYSYNRQAELIYYTLDAEADYGFAKMFRIGAGTKYNHLFGAKDYWGKSLRLGVDIKKLGAFQLHYEKSYLPTIQQSLYPVEIGRVSWYKTF